MFRSTVIVSTKCPDCVYPNYVFVVIFFFVVWPTRVSFKHPLSVYLIFSDICKYKCPDCSFTYFIFDRRILSLLSGLFVLPACARVSLKHPQGRLYSRVQLGTKGVHHLRNKVSVLYCFLYALASLGTE